MTPPRKSLQSAGASCEHSLVKRRVCEIGATLIEALMVIALLGILAVSIHGIYSIAYTSAGRAQRLEQASLLAEERLERLKVRSQCNSVDALNQPREPVDPANFPGFMWEVNAQEKEPGLNQVMVTVFWSEGRREHQVSMATYLRARDRGP